MTRIWTAGKLTAALCAVAVVGTGCSDLVVKVTRAPKNYSQPSSLATPPTTPAGVLGLLDKSPNFLSDLDSLKATALDDVIAALKAKDYRGEVRSAIRGYREYLINTALNPKLAASDNFYADSGASCRKSSVNFNITDANAQLGSLLKIAVLAKLTEAGANALGSQAVKTKVSDDVQLINAFIETELGIKVSGSTTVDHQDNQTITTSDVTLQVMTDDSEDAATRAKDAAEVIKLKFTRTAEDHHLGTYSGTVSIGHLNTDGSTDNVVSSISVDSKLVNNVMQYDASLVMGIDGKTPSYSRSVNFQQDPKDSSKLEMTDDTNKGMPSEQVYTTVIDLKQGTQCKGTLSDLADAGTGDEGGFLPPSDGKGSSDHSSDKGSTPPASDSGASSSSGSPSTSGDGSSTTVGTPNKGGTTPGDDNGSTPVVIGDGSKGGNDAGSPSNPTQAPTQAPSQFILKK